MIKLIFLTALSWLGGENPSDSVRLETVNGKQFVIHRVDEKETLYSISRRYGTPVTAIIEANPETSGSLTVGKELRVPYTPKTRSTASGIHKVQPKETLYSIARLYNISVDDLKAWNYLTGDATISVGQELRVKKPSSVSGTSTTSANNETASPSSGHTVAEGETLYAISRKYKISVDQLKEWNKLAGNDVRVGQVLVVSAPTATNAATNRVNTEVTAPVLKEEPKPVVREEVKTTPTPTPTATTNEPTIHISENVAGTDEVKETGLAELIDGTEGNRKYLAMHRTAKTGTIIKVRNELNNREVFVRVVGNLPDTGVNDKLVIKISKSAYDRLGAIDPKFRVEVTYYK